MVGADDLEAPQHRAEHGYSSSPTKIAEQDRNTFGFLERLNRLVYPTCILPAVWEEGA